MCSKEEFPWSTLQLIIHSIFNMSSNHVLTKTIKNLTPSWSDSSQFFEYSLILTGRVVTMTDVESHWHKYIKAWPIKVQRKIYVTYWNLKRKFGKIYLTLYFCIMVGFLEYLLPLKGACVQRIKHCSIHALNEEVTPKP